MINSKMLGTALIATAILSVAAQYEGEERYGVGRGRVEAGRGGEWGQGIGELGLTREGYGHRHNNGYNGQNGQPGWNSDRDREGVDPRGYDRKTDPRGYDRNEDSRGYGRAEAPRYGVGDSSSRYRRSPQGLGGGGLGQSDGMGSGGLSRSEGLGGGGGLGRSEGLGGGLSRNDNDGGFGGGLSRRKRRTRLPALKRRHCNSFYGKIICYQIFPEEENNMPSQLSCWRTINGDHNCTEVENLLYLDEINVRVDPNELEGIKLPKNYNADISNDDIFAPL